VLRRRRCCIEYPDDRVHRHNALHGFVFDGAFLTVFPLTV